MSIVVPIIQLLYLTPLYNGSVCVAMRNRYKLVHFMLTLALRKYLRKLIWGSTIQTFLSISGCSQGLYILFTLCVAVL